MSKYVLFQMPQPLRQSFIKSHQFYVAQANRRLLSQFSHIESESDQASSDWLDNNKSSFHPDYHDPGDFYESARDAGINFYLLLSEMREQTFLSVVAGMYHQWDKQFRQWLVDEIKHWCSSEALRQKIWKVNSGDLVDLMKTVGWNLSEQPYYPVIDACRLVVNIYKHGDGQAVADLRTQHSKYLVDEFAGGLLESSDPFCRPLNYTHLKINAADIQEFSDAIVAFWNDVPDNIHDNHDLSPPAWFIKARLKQDSTLEKPAAHG